jgi:hypothetical protein
MIFGPGELDFIDAEDLLLEIGDEVAFECGELDSSRPRWDFNEDLGESGIWASGVITYIDEKIIQTEYEIDGFFGKGICTWPNNEHEEYDPLQWTQEGYLMLTKKRSVCECGSEAVYGLVTSHSHWCPKYNKLEQ